MILIKGLDIGNGFCKYEMGKRFASKVRKGKLTKVASGIKIANEVHEIIYEDEHYIVGDGNSFIGRERYFTKEYEIAFLTAIALSNKEKKNPVEVHAVIGVPFEHHNSDAVKIQEHLNALGVKKITVDGIDHIIDIKEITVFVEGALPIKDNDDSHIITIDVGMGTVNIVEWEGQTAKNPYTNNGSFNIMYQELSSFLNDKHGTSLNPDMCEKFISKPTLNTKHGTVDISEDVERLLVGTISNMISFTKKIDFEGADKIEVFGGGSIDTFHIWKEHFPKATLVPNSQYINQEIYQAVAESIYEA